MEQSVKAWVRHVARSVLALGRHELPPHVGEAIVCFVVIGVAVAWLSRLTPAGREGADQHGIAPGIGASAAPTTAPAGAQSGGTNQGAEKPAAPGLAIKPALPVEAPQSRVSSLQLSSPRPVVPGCTYELCGLLKTWGSSPSALCVGWSQVAYGPTRAFELGELAPGATRARRVTARFLVPSWAVYARFGCAAVREGTASLEQAELREAERALPPHRLTAKGLVLEFDRRGVFTICAGRTLLLTGGQALLRAGNRAYEQRLGTAKSAQVGPAGEWIRFTGQLGPADGATFEQEVSGSREGLTLHYRLEVGGLPDARPEIEVRAGAWSISRTSLGLQDGSHATHTPPFGPVHPVRCVVIGTRTARIFLRSSRPLTVSADRSPRYMPTWRFGFPRPEPGTATDLELALTFADAGKVAATVKEYNAARQAELRREYGQALTLYERFLAEHPLYFEESGRAEDRLARLKGRIESELKRIKTLGARAVQSRSARDRERFERECQQLAIRLAGHPMAAAVQELLDQVKGERTAAALKELEKLDRERKEWEKKERERKRKEVQEKEREKKADQILASAQKMLGHGEVRRAKRMLRLLIDRYPKTDPAARAAQLLSQYR